MGYEKKPHQWLTNEDHYTIADPENQNKIVLFFLGGQQRPLIECWGDFFHTHTQTHTHTHTHTGARSSSVVKTFVHGGPIELFLVPASAPRLV